MTQPTAFARIATALQAALQADPAIAPAVYIARVRTLPEQGGAALVVRPGRAERESSAGLGAPALWVSAYALECYARGSASSPADAAVDALLGAAVERLMADPSLGGLVGYIDPQSIDWDYDVDGAQTACATVTFIVRHASAAATLT